MAEPGLVFGTELRRAREAAGLSLAQLARLVHYSKAYLGKVETGVKVPLPELARRCDDALHADGVLAELVPAGSASARLDVDRRRDSEVWWMSLGTSGQNWFRPTTGEAPAFDTGYGISGEGIAASARQPAVVEGFRRLFDEMRSLGQTASPGTVLPILIAQTHTLRSLASHARLGLVRRC